MEPETTRAYGAQSAQEALRAAETLELRAYA